MKRIDRFVPVELESCPWLETKMPNGDRKGIQFRRILPGRDGLPHMIYSRYDPNWTEPRHRHPEDEVLILVQGELTIEGTTYQAPASIFVGRGTLYGPLTAGAEGAEFYRVAYSEEMIRQQPAPAEA